DGVPHLLRGRLQDDLLADLEVLGHDCAPQRVVASGPAGVSGSARGSVGPTGWASAGTAGWWSMGPLGSTGRGSVGPTGWASAGTAGCRAMTRRFSLPVPAVSGSAAVWYFPTSSVTAEVSS